MQAFAISKSQPINIQKTLEKGCYIHGETHDTKEKVCKCISNHDITSPSTSYSKVAV
jgi:hypothetical protein